VRNILALLAAAAAAALSTPAAADSDGRNRNVRVENHSNLSALIRVTFTNPHGRTYDAMPGVAIDHGYNRVLSFDDGEGHGHCVYTLRAEFANGVYATRTNLNVCQARVWRIYDVDNRVDY